MEDMTNETMKERSREFVKKLMSFKNYIFVITCAMTILGWLPWQAWLSVTGIVLGCNTGMKALHIRSDERRQEHIGLECGG